MTTEAASTTAKPIAEQAIEQAAAGAAAAAPAASEPAAAAPPRYNAFADEDAALAEAERQAAEEAERSRAGGQAAPTGTQPAAGSAAAGAAPTGGEPGSAQPGAAPAGSAAAAEAAAASTQGSQTAALIAMRKKLQEEREGRLVAEGKAQALETLVQAGATRGQPGDQAGQQQQDGTDTGATELERGIAELDDQKLALAEQYERGDITATEWKKREVEIDRQQRRLQEQRSAEVAAAAAAEAAASTAASVAQQNDGTLATQLATMEARYPILKDLTAEQLAFFEPLAYQRAAIMKIDLPSNAIGTYRLRELMVREAERFYDPAAFAAREAAEATARAAAKAGQGGAAPASGAAPAGGNGNPTAQPTAAQREEKLRLAASLPPDISKIGSGAGASEVSDDQATAALMGVSEDQALKWLEANPSFQMRVSRGSLSR